MKRMKYGSSLTTIIRLNTTFKFTFEFIKEFLSIKDLPYVFLLGLLFRDWAFVANNLTLLEELSRLKIPLGRNELLLRLNWTLDDIPMFWKAVQTLNVTYPYSLRYAGGKAFNENILTHLVGNISEAIQNLIMGYASIATFLKHYLSRRITVDTQAVVREHLKRTLRNPTKQPKQRRRHALLKDVKEQWEFEQLVRDVERQLAGLETNDDLELVHDIMLPAQKKLCDSVLSKPGATIEEEVARRNCAIYAVTLYCGIEEGGMSPIRKGGRSRNAALPAKSQPGHEQELLELAKVSVYKEKRPRVCFLCLGNEGLPLAQRIYAFSTPGDLSKHFGRKHLKNIQTRRDLSCKLCMVPLVDKTHLQRHAEEIHGTVSPRHSYT
ncbi:hypothetical protein PSV08DRAFT_369849 [Bipolaris maydis]|uniref:uncharacterized protein n=1 Tax=Cochliobolus heterostrophus TaxID=5016 RepID=UPI0024D79D9A|nr:hypothetical protein J3E73DRAFT_389508 [Bipolaris maydis]KAJ6273085.1 hypothetical protein PSV08DRAFT_369849 [Bipolaris maydis]